MTKLAVAIFAERLDVALAQAALAAERGADMVEYRLDRFADPPQRAADLARRSPLPCIVTCRPLWEGGEFEGDEDSRVAMLEHAAQGLPAYLDFELAAWQRNSELRERITRIVAPPDSTGDEEVSAENPPRSTLPRLILSSHDFGGRPADLLRRVQAMAAEPLCRVIKVAWRARSLRDNLEAFELIRQRFKPTIALCMGEFGLPSRVLAKKFGALLTFAGLDEETVTAPGQPGVETLKRLYRWEALNADTAVYGVIGWPVAHSHSPRIHNAGFASVDHNGVYLPLPIPFEYEHFKATLSAWLDDAHLDFRGASVTIPHKQNLLRFIVERSGAAGGPGGGAGEVEPLAARIGAANTLAVRPDGALYACNTDYAAALDAVCHAMSIAREQLTGERVAILGAGGAGRAIAAAFAHYGATVVIYNRTLEKAQQLADDLSSSSITAAPLEELAQTNCQIVINCTPIGMSPDIDATPIPANASGWPKALGPGGVVFDTIYNPPETRLLRDAKARGCTTISGTEMFTRQAAAQFQLWTGKPAPVELFGRVLG